MASLEQIKHQLAEKRRLLQQQHQSQQQTSNVQPIKLNTISNAPITLNDDDDDDDIDGVPVQTSVIKHNDTPTDSTHKIHNTAIEQLDVTTVQSQQVVPQCSNPQTQHIIDQLLLNVQKHGTRFIDTVIQRSAANSTLQFLFDTCHIDHAYWLYRYQQAQNDSTANAANIVVHQSIPTINTSESAPTERKRRRFTESSDATTPIPVNNNANTNTNTNTTHPTHATQFLQQYHATQTQPLLQSGPAQSLSQSNYTNYAQHNSNTTVTAVDSDSDDDFYESSTVSRIIDRHDLSPINRSWTQYNGSQLVQQTHKQPKHHLSYYMDNSDSGNTAKALDSRNVGFNILRNMGWVIGTALGRYRTGIVEPIATDKLTNSKKGLGQTSTIYSNVDNVNDASSQTNADAYASYRANMIKAYNNRQQHSKR